MRACALACAFDGRSAFEQTKAHLQQPHAPSAAAASGDGNGSGRAADDCDAVGELQGPLDSRQHQQQSGASLLQSTALVDVGTSASDPTLRKTLAIGADEVIRIDSKPKDSYSVAKELAKVISEPFSIPFINNELY